MPPVAPYRNAGVGIGSRNGISFLRSFLRTGRRGLADISEADARVQAA